ncbi:sporulation protein YqfC [Pelagirhabdus alkalitolerans]|uniref:Sporulation protein YqfC n=1 Tax=Pelagirhabdus alkalitolerans TaxID=1612202 RepID=A0A1G6HVQ2_9BACI|nr:YabP/YqfC family sporulation protein [Pelagirhabdus alkalitolerans]SDB98270.1 sporulation protein YqfC [Pelagirhabdus alkalitolerans]
MLKLINQVKSYIDNHDIVNELKLAKVTTVGTIHTYVENHQGIISFTSKQIKLEVPNGSIDIFGKELMINRLEKDEVIIEGEIDLIKLNDSDRGDNPFSQR